MEWKELKQASAGRTYEESKDLKMTKYRFIVFMTSAFKFKCFLV